MLYFGFMTRVEIEFKGNLWSAKEFVDKMEVLHTKAGYPAFRSPEDKEKKVESLGRWMGKGTISINGEPALIARGEELGSCLKSIHKVCPIPTVIRNQSLVFEWEKE